MSRGKPEALAPSDPLGWVGAQDGESRNALIPEMVGERGFEPPTPWSRTRCSTRLSHSPTRGFSPDVSSVYCTPPGPANFLPPAASPRSVASPVTPVKLPHPAQAAGIPAGQWQHDRRECGGSAYFPTTMTSKLPAIMGGRARGLSGVGSGLGPNSAVTT